MTKKTVKYAVLLLVLAITSFSAFSCAKKDAGELIEPDDSGTVAESTSAVTLPEGDSSTPLRGTESDADTFISLSADGISVEGAGAAADESAVIISAAGSYEITGEAEQAKIIVDTTDSDTVKLILNGAGINNSLSSAIEVTSAPKKVNIHLQEGSVNIITDGSTRGDEDTATAAIWSAGDLKFSGSGDLFISALYDRGIFSKDDIEISGGNISVSAVGEGIRGRDSVEISDGTVTVSSGEDGIRTDEAETEGKGRVLISGGSVSIVSGGDGIFAATDLSVTGGTISVTSGGGASNATPSQSMQNDRFSFGGNPGGVRPGDTEAGFGGQTATEADDTTVSTKGIKADGSVTVSGGSITIDSCDDGFHSGTDLIFQGGTATISAGDDGIHADTSLSISGGEITIGQSYEGLESEKIEISGGSAEITASDDGVNASGTSSPLLSITGGYIFVNSSGDGLDSNGNIEMSGGTAIVAGPTDNSNGALDSGDNNNHIALTGGLLIAYGSSGMAEYPTASLSTQNSLCFSVSASQGELVYITDSGGNAVAAFSLLKNAENVVISSPSFASGETYTVYAGGSCSGEEMNGVYSGGSCSGGSSCCELTVSSTVTTDGSVSGPGGFRGGFGGGMGGRA